MAIRYAEMLSTRDAWGINWDGVGVAVVVEHGRDNVQVRCNLVLPYRQRLHAMGVWTPHDPCPFASLACDFVRILSITACENGS